MNNVNSKLGFNFLSAEHFFNGRHDGALKLWSFRCDT